MVVIIFFFIHFSLSEKWIYRPKDISSLYIIKTDTCYSYNQQGYYFSYKNNILVTSVYESTNCKEPSISSVAVNISMYGFEKVNEEINEKINENDEKQMIIGSITYNASQHCINSSNCIRQHYFNGCFIIPKFYYPRSIQWIVENNNLELLLFKGKDCIYLESSYQYPCDTCLDLPLDFIVYCNNSVSLSLLFILLVVLLI